jgi:arylsulfatase A-like enzyme
MRPNILLIVCDTLRPDFLSTYGGTVETELFDSLAEEGSVFDRAYAAGPGSSISHAALFTGQYPSTSGVGGQVSVPPDVPLLAALLSDHGYETFGLPGPSRTGSHLGYDRGFDYYLEKWSDIPSGFTFNDIKLAIQDPQLLVPMPSEVFRRCRYGDDNYTSYLLDVFERKIRNLEEPYFGFLNLTTVHTPYDPPRSYKQRATPKLRRPSTGLGEILNRGEQINRSDIRLNRLSAAQQHEGVARFYENRSYLRDAEIDVLRKWYSASIRYLDDQLTTTFQHLRRSGELDNTVIVLTADHGEQFGEHGVLKHMYFHFKQCLHVPLVVTGPSVPDERRSDYVSLVDIFPTVCNLVGIDVPDSLDGRSVFGPASERRDAAFAENGQRELSNLYHKILSKDSINEFARGIKSVRNDEYLYTIDSAGRQRLYDRPDEMEIPLSEGPVHKLRNRVCDTLGEAFPPGSQSMDNLDQTVVTNLRRLGYIE